ncbi:unnamed protein product [Ostreobium quekettii]|uniref:Protein kinase domain-containing protein n=1 Tax=Ostreobium quekettii TaxID=121088 RepID=A0A8S1J8Z3_9CHLO|nr:unnamed protein product [Ostreobium quekettii]|eukprot:evm.model.scf_331.2 EVM.evm.TU.scf_331.2   scf_331:50924-54985(+)
MATLCLSTTVAILLLCGIALHQHDQDSSQCMGPSIAKQKKRANGTTRSPVALRRVLGQGQGSTVYKARYHGKDAVAKIVSCADTSRDDLWGVHAAKRLEHPNLVQVYTVGRVVDGFPAARNVDTEGSIWGANFSFGSGKADDRCSATEKGFIKTCIVMERCRLGNLRSAIRRGWFCHTGQFKNPKMLHIVTVAHQVALSMKYLHSCGIIHGNLQRSNVLLHKRVSLCTKSQITVKVCLSMLSHWEGNRICHPDLEAFPLTSLLHMAPEVLQGGATSKASDVYSFGVLLWEVVTGREVSGESQRRDLVEFIRDGHRPKVPAYCHPGYAALIASCWNQDRRKRPGFDVIVSRLAEMLSELARLQDVHATAPATLPAASCTGIGGSPASFFDTAHALGELPLEPAATAVATSAEAAQIGLNEPGPNRGA